MFSLLSQLWMALLRKCFRYRRDWIPGAHFRSQLHHIRSLVKVLLLTSSLNLLVEIKVRDAPVQRAQGLLSIKDVQVDSTPNPRLRHWVIVAVHRILLSGILESEVAAAADIRRPVLVGKYSTRLLLSRPRLRC